MSRVRTDNVFGTTTDAPLTAGATTMNSAGLANLAVVSSAEAIIVLDPNRVSGAPEIVVVTAHTGSATSATIVRGQFGTSAREHAAGTEWVHGPIASNASSFVTAADDQGDFVPMNAWEAYTPSNTNITVGNGTQTARFLRQGRLITVHYQLVWGSTTAFGGSVAIGLPVACVSGQRYASGLQLLDNDTSWNTGIIVPGRGTSADDANKALLTSAGTAPRIVNSTNPFTWTTSDAVITCFSYEAAS